MRHIVNKVAWVLAGAISLLVLAFLTGGVRDGTDGSALASDSQPGIAISGQGVVGPEQVVCLPVGDDDCDGFSTTLELHVGTLPLVACGIGINAWAADLNRDTFSDMTDVSAMTANFGRSILTAPVRQDIAPEAAGDGIIDISDVSKLTSFFGLKCS